MVIAGLLMYCINIYIVAGNTTYKYAIELWNHGRESLHILYPLIFSIPFCWILYHEKSNSYWKNVFNRTILSKYIQKRLLLAAMLSAVAMMIVSLGSLLFAYIIAPGNSSIFEPIMEHTFKGQFQIDFPVLYALILSLWRSVISALYTTLGIGITLISKNVFVAMTGAFLYSISENFVTAILQVPVISVSTSFYPNRLANSVISLPKLMIGPLLLRVCRKTCKALTQLYKTHYMRYAKRSETSKK